MCYQSVVWAMGHGIKSHSDWYPGLTASSTFKEFQALLHDKYPEMSGCPRPCAPETEATSTEADGQEEPSSEPLPTPSVGQQRAADVHGPGHVGSPATEAGGPARTAQGSTSNVATTPSKAQGAVLTATPTTLAATRRAVDQAALAAEAAYEDDVLHVAGVLPGGDSAPAQSAGKSIRHIDDAEESIRPVDDAVQLGGVLAPARFAYHTTAGEITGDAAAAASTGKATLKTPTTI